MKYVVEQKYFDSGHVNVSIKKCADIEESFHEERETYDYYYDVCDTLEEAEIIKNECLNA